MSGPGSVEIKGSWASETLKEKYQKGVLGVNPATSVSGPLSLAYFGPRAMGSGKVETQIVENLKMGFQKWMPCPSTEFEVLVKQLKMGFQKRMTGPNT